MSNSGLSSDEFAKAFERASQTIARAKLTMEKSSEFLANWYRETDQQTLQLQEWRWVDQEELL